MNEREADVARCELAASHLSYCASQLRSLANNATDPLVARELNRAADGCDDGASDVRGVSPYQEAV